MGGLGIRDPVELYDVDFTSSQAWATVIFDVVRGFAELDWSEHLARVQAASVSRCHQILDQFSEACQRTIRRAVGGGISHWLTTFPSECYHFDLAPTEFIEMPWP